MGVTLHPLVRRLARAVPYTRRLNDGIEAMRAHIGNLERSVAVLTAQVDRQRAPRCVSGTEAVYMIDAAWCDTAGLFVAGWAHAGPHRVREIALMSEDGRAATSEFVARLDVGPHYAGLPDNAAAGFSLYLPGGIGVPLSLAIVTDAGTAELPLRPPSRPAEDPTDGIAVLESFVAAMCRRGGAVLEVGARSVGTLTSDWRTRFEPACRYIANDIHSGAGIDIVGDVHTLSDHVAPGSLDGVFSVAVLEHLAAPWLAAAAINRALKPGGETVHYTHQTWPMHELPNDFFRMSDSALRSLFGPATGFEVLECGMSHPVAITPPLHLRHSAWLRLPEGRGYAQSFIRARKVAESHDTAAPLAAAMEAISREYPRSTPISEASPLG